MTKADLNLMRWISGTYTLCNHEDSYFLAWWSLTAQEKGLFQDSEELEMN